MIAHPQIGWKLANYSHLKHTYAYTIEKHGSIVGHGALNFDFSNCSTHDTGFLYTVQLSEHGFKL